MGERPQGRQQERLDCFVGKWRNSGQTQPGPFGPGGATAGRTAYRWEMGGKWLVYTSHLDIPGMGEYEVRGGVAFDGQADRYDAFAINTLGKLIVYEGVWTDQATLVFTQSHPLPAGRSRIVYRILSGDSMRMSSELLTESGDWKAYFDTEMTRV
jgi:hypothetical protein